MAAVAEKYDEVQVFYQGNDGQGLIDKLSPSKGAFVLDLGCGTGFLASVLAKRVGPEGKVTGVDPDKERLRIAQTQKYGCQENIEFLYGSGEIFPEGPYDAVFSNYVLHWIEDKESVFRNVYDNLKVGGKFAFTASGNPSSLFWELSTNAKSLFMCSSGVYENIATKCGFEVEFKSVDQAKYSFANIKACIDWVNATVNVNTNTVDLTTLEGFKKRFGDESVNVDFPRIMFLLKKTY